MLNKLNVSQYCVNSRFSKKRIAATWADFAGESKASLGKKAGFARAATRRVQTVRKIVMPRAPKARAMLICRVEAPLQGGPGNRAAFFMTCYGGHSRLVGCVYANELHTRHR